MTELVLLMRVIVVLAYFLACAPVSLHAEPVRISYSAISWLMTPVWMAEELGLFKKYNLEAQLIYIPSSATSVQSLLGGSVDVITPGSMMTITRSFLQERRDTVERVLCAYVEGMAAYLGQKERAK